ncbi:TPA: hypothetical protein MIY91_26355 [Klebsiella pneumoniae]|nr:hypothetical protein [Klebsiella pneumoniae]
MINIISCMILCNMHNYHIIDRFSAAQIRKLSIPDPRYFPVHLVRSFKVYYPLKILTQNAREPDFQ